MKQSSVQLEKEITQYSTEIDTNRSKKISILDVFSPSDLSFPQHSLVLLTPNGFL